MGTDWARRIADVVNRLEIPQPFTIEAFVASVAAQHGRRVELVGTRSMVGPCGMLLRTPSVDFLCFDARATPVVASRTVAHEVGHLILGHAMVSVEALTRLASRFPDLPPALIQSMVNRSIRGRRAEEAADLVADLIMARTMIGRREPAQQLPGLHAAFGVGRRDPGQARSPLMASLGNAIGLLGTRSLAPWWRPAG
jgi:hypothetical protein